LSRRVGRGWRIARVAAALAGATACDDTPVANAGEPPPEVVATSVLAGQGGIFRSLAVELDRAGAVVVEYWSADGARLRTESLGEGAAHEIFLPRLAPERDYAYDVRPLSAAGDAGEAVRGTFRTGGLPAALAALELSVIGRASFDLLLLEIGAPAGPHLPVVVDTRGNVVWHGLVAGRAAFGFTHFEDSLFAFNSPDGLRVVSPRSQTEVASLTRARAAGRTGVQPFFIHHDVIATPAGTLLFLVNDRSVARDTVWAGEAVWEWDPRSDALARRWRSADFLSPATDRGPRTTPDDWLHANSLALGPRGNVLMSLFWLHEVLSIAPDWRSVEWRLGGPASTFRGVEEAMEAGQHTAEEVAPDRVLLFDNGLDRRQGRFSRALEIQLDRASGSAEVVWEFRPNPDIYAPIVSSARRLPNGNTVVGFGLAAGFAAPAAGVASGPLAVYEVTPAGEVPWRLEVVRGAQLVYRATPLASVAGERWACPPACAPSR
jgi:hypothetical protein